MAGFLQALGDAGKTLYAELTGGTVAPSQPTEAVNPNLGNGSTATYPLTNNSSNIKNVGLAAILIPAALIMAGLAAVYFIGRSLKWW